MSLVERESTPARVAASQANGKKSNGPSTPEGKARVSLNALKTGAYAKSDRARREVMLRRGENPDDFEQLHQELTEDWRPGHVTEAMLVKTIAEKSFDVAQLQAARMERQLNSLRTAEVQAERQRLLTRRWLPGMPNVPKGEQPPLWLAKDSPSKFHTIFQILDDLQKWYDNRVTPDTFGRDMHTLYGEYHSRAGERIRTLFIEMYEDDQDAAAKAEVELPKWIAQERRDVERERDLYRQEWELKANAGPNLVEEEVAKKEAALEKQIREQTRLLLQLKKTRPQWDAPSSGPSEEQKTGNREPGIGDRENSHRAPQSETQETASEAASSSQSPVPTERGAVDGAPPAKPIGSPSVGPSFGSSGGSSFGSSSGLSGGGSTTREAKSVAEGTAMEQKTTVDDEVAEKNEKMGESNLTSAA
ncbi:MAG TPA: hypothetical protein VKM93_23320 [Terriglobia bacterium]|nr:hypothetical protein [Terriglobia bacterium]